jgi:hypothetical protein
VVQDDNRGCKRLSTGAFKPSSGENGGMSVDIEAKIIEAGLTPTEYVTNPTFIGSVSIQASAVRALNLWIGYDPLPENPHHGEVWGQPPRVNRFSKEQQKGLLAASNWYVQLRTLNCHKCLNRLMPTSPPPQVL